MVQLIKESQYQRKEDVTILTYYTHTRLHTLFPTPTRHQIEPIPSTQTHSEDWGHTQSTEIRPTLAEHRALLSGLQRASAERNLSLQHQFSSGLMINSRNTTVADGQLFYAIRLHVFLFFMFPFPFLCLSNIMLLNLFKKCFIYVGFHIIY